MRSLICTLLSAVLIVVSIPEAAPQQAPPANVQRLRRPRTRKSSDSSRRALMTAAMSPSRRQRVTANGCAGGPRWPVRVTRGYA